MFGLTLVLPGITTRLALGLAWRIGLTLVLLAWRIPCGSLLALGLTWTIGLTLVLLARRIPCQQTRSTSRTST
jgi:hypothetical protein